MPRRSSSPARSGSGRATPRGATASRATWSTAAIAIVVEQPEPYVSRGGYKLAAALDAFAIDPAGLTALDVGASTGGFTDVLLQRGARRVYALDVGRGQLAEALRRDRRVVSLERTNARSLTATTLPEPIDLAVIDVSFISLDKVLGPIVTTLRPAAPIVALVKPQFEAGRGGTDRGVVRDPAIHRRGPGADVVVAARAAGLGTRDVDRLAAPGARRATASSSSTWPPDPGCAEIGERIAAVVAATPPEEDT